MVICEQAGQHIDLGEIISHNDDIKGMLIEKYHAETKGQ